jgi:hypothetical protein
VVPHLGVHRGREHDRAAGRQQDRGQQIISPPLGGPGQQVGSGGSDQHQAGLLPELDMRLLVDALPGAGGDRLAGERGPGGGTDEPQRILGGHHPDPVA